MAILPFILVGTRIRMFLIKRDDRATLFYLSPLTFTTITGYPYISYYVLFVCGWTVLFVAGKNEYLHSARYVFDAFGSYFHQKYIMYFWWRYNRNCDDNRSYSCLFFYIYSVFITGVSGGMLEKAVLCSAVHVICIFLAKNNNGTRANYKSEEGLHLRVIMYVVNFNFLWA